MDRREIKFLEKTAYEMRQDVVHMGPRANITPHIAPAFSCADIVAALYFKFMKLNPQDPKDPDRDRFVISKGHACMILYAALARRGFFPQDWLWNVKNVGSKLQGHPDMNKTPGVDSTSGSLGNGLSMALGMAMALKYQKNYNRKVFCIIGDGDSQEGMIWEAAAMASTRRVDNLIAILDFNHLQGSGQVEDIINMEPVVDRWKSFGWNVMEVNGHCMEDICTKLDIAVHYHGKPTILIAHTVKGKGVSFMEHNNAWHARGLKDSEYAQAIEELQTRINQIEEET